MLNILHLRHRTFENLLQKIVFDFFLDHVQTIHLCHKSTVAAFTFVDGWKFEEICRIYLLAGLFVITDLLDAC